MSSHGQARNAYGAMQSTSMLDKKFRNSLAASGAFGKKPIDYSSPHATISQFKVPMKNESLPPIEQLQPSRLNYKTIDP